METTEEPIVAPRRFSRSEWIADAACRGMDTNLFFPTRGGDSATAKAVCVNCPVRIPCGQYAVDEGEHYGIWGGLGERTRRIARRGQDVATLVALPRPPRRGRARGPRPPCGTEEGYHAHRRYGEASCDACRSAHALANRHYQMARRRRGGAA